MKAKVKVMRSYDYCHFEIELASDDDLTFREVNDLRKQSAILVDEAVRQYKEMKAAEPSYSLSAQRRGEAKERYEAMKTKPWNELTPEDAAFLRAYEDGTYWAYCDNDYDYGYDNERDHHFAMLNKPKKTVRG